MGALQTVSLKNNDGTPRVFNGCLLGDTTFRLLTRRPAQRTTISIYQREDGKFLWIHEYVQPGQEQDSRWVFELDTWKQVGAVFWDLYHFFSNDLGMKGAGKHFYNMVMPLLDEIYGKVIYPAALLERIEAIGNRYDLIA